MGRKTKALRWFPFKRTLGDIELEGEYAIDGRLIRVRSKHHPGEKVTQLGGMSGDPEGFAVTLAMELAKGR